MRKEKTNKPYTLQDLDFLVARMPGHFYWKDTQGRYLGCSDGALKLLGLGSQDFIGKTDLQLWPKQARLFKEYDDQVLLCRNAITVEETLTLHNGEQKVFLITRLPMVDGSNTVIGIINNLCEITAYKKREIELKNDLINMEHELKEAKEENLSIKKTHIGFLENLRVNFSLPVTNILTVAERLQRKQSTDVQECVESILTSSKVLQNLLKDCLKEGSATQLDALSFQANLALDDLQYTSNPVLPQTPITYENTRILIVEDHPITAKITQKILSDLNCFVEVAIHGEAAIECIQNESYDLILMDIGLPDIDGYEATRRIRMYESTKKNIPIPIIGLTARVDGENKQRCIESGMNAVFSKPLIKEKVQHIFLSFVPKSTGEQSIMCPFESSNEEIIDLKLGAHLIGGDENLAKEAILMLVNSFPDDLNKLEKAYLKKDWAVMQVIIHKLRGGTSYCGTPRLKAACIRLDDALELGQNELINDLYGQLLFEIEAVQKESMFRS